MLNLNLCVEALNNRTAIPEKKMSVRQLKIICFQCTWFKLWVLHENIIRRLIKQSKTDDINSSSSFAEQKIYLNQIKR